MITLADRRAIMTMTSQDSDFSALLRSDARAAVKKATGKDTSEYARVAVVEEQSDAWEFIVPATQIEAELPASVDARGSLENDVYAELRDNPSLRDRIVNDPKGFLKDHLQFDIGDTGVNVREEQSDELLLILPYGDSRDELNDAALDLVAGGGDPGCRQGEAGGGGTTEAPKG